MNDIPGQLHLFGDPPPAPSKGPGPAPVDPALAALGPRLPDNLWLGTSSWSFPGWAGLVYAARHAESRLAQRGLSAYACHPLLRAVGLDRTFYAPVEVGTLKGYAEAVPAHFRFLAKAHELCTLSTFPEQPRYGSMAGQVNPEFLRADYAAEQVVQPLIEGLGERLGAVLFQFPPQEARDPAAFAVRLHDFLEALPPGPSYAVEVRNRRLLGPAYAAVLERLGVVHCLNVHPSMPDLPSQARRVHPQSLLLVRWMLGGSQNYQEAVERYHPFDRLQDEDPTTRSAIAGLCREALDQGRRVMVIINNKAEGCAPLSVRKLAEELV